MCFSVTVVLYMYMCVCVSIAFIAFKFLIVCVHSFTSCGLPRISNMHVYLLSLCESVVVGMILPHRLGGHFVARRSDAELRRIW